jgi:hypothetical protein
MLLAIDPGTHTGWARFDCRYLLACGYVYPRSWWSLVRPYDLVIIEEPTIYPHSKANPVSIMTLQLKVGELKGRFESVGCKVELVQPRTWKHQVPKAIHNARTIAALIGDEKALVDGQRHDTIDAVGLGLWKLGRMK